MTIEHTPQCDKITCKAFGMNRQAVPVSGAGHALVDLAGVARVKAHGEIAHKGEKEFNMTSSSLTVRIQDLPFNKDVQPLVIQDPGTEIDIFKQDPNDWRCQNMWNGCKKLR